MLIPMNPENAREIVAQIANEKRAAITSLERRIVDLEIEVVKDPHETSLAHLRLLRLRVARARLEAEALSIVLEK